MSGLERIAAEYQRCRQAEGFNAQHDDEHDGDELANAAACYALPEPRRLRAVSRTRTQYTDRDGSSVQVPTGEYAMVPSDWPWSPEWWKPTPQDRIRELAKAGNLIACEIDRLERAAKQAGE